MLRRAQVLYMQIDTNKIINEYINEKLIIKTIAKLHKRSPNTISKILHNNSITVSKLKQNLINKKIGRLTVLRLSSIRKNKRYVYWDCLCECGNIISVIATSLISKSTKSCGCLLKDKNRIRLSQGIGDISKTYWNKILRTAKRRKLEINITIEYIWNLYLQQNKKCAITDINITFGTNAENYKKVSASLDRIDSSKGYIIGNVQWVHKKVNMLKHINNESDLIYWCKLIGNGPKSNTSNQILLNNYLEYSKL